jgi:HEAT repeat protein
LLCDRDPAVRVAAATTLGLYNSAAGEAAKALGKGSFLGDPEARMPVMRAIEGLGREAGPAIPSLIKALSDREPRVRRAAAEVLGHFGAFNPDKSPALANYLRTTVVPALRGVLEDPDPDVRRAASEALLSYGP